MTKKLSEEGKTDRLTYKLWPEFGRLIGLGRTATYLAAQRGEIPTYRIGGVVVVPKRKAHEMFGI